MKKQFFAFFVLIVAALCAIPQAYASPDPYWAAQKEYTDAIDNGDDNALISAVDQILKVYPSPSGKNEYLRVAFPCENAGKACERLKRYSDAVKYYKKAIKYLEWLNKNDRDYSDSIRGINALIKHNEGMFEVYAQTSGNGDVPFRGAINEPEPGAGTQFGICSDEIEGNQSAKLVYVQFFNEEISSFGWMFPKDNTQLVEIAWNVPNENYADLEKVCGSKDYIERNVKWLAAQNYKFLVRFGAEINCWADLDKYTAADQINAYCTKFKQAFITVANAVHTYAHNCAVVYSPNFVSNWHYSPEAFYPGDEYVDWVGMSSYCNLIPGVSKTVSNGTDAWYSRGYYENQLMSIRGIIESFGDRKPIMISECGCKYADKNGLNTEEHAVEALKYFYTYVNMVYPQVRAVFYFNANYGGECYSLKNKAVYDAYDYATKNNSAMQLSLENGKNYVSLKNYKDSSNNITLYTFRYLPGGNSRVKYILDGKQISSASDYPYKCEFSISEPGMHKLSVVAENGKETVSKDYLIITDEQEKAEITESAMADVPCGNWAFIPVTYVVKKGLFNGVTDTSFSPSSKLTRGMLVTVIGRLEGITADKNAKTQFTDVPAGKYYTGYVAWASKNNIVNGISSDKFKPNANITREQVATILYRYAQNKGYDVAGNADLSGYDDAGKISSYALSAMKWANKNSIINGRSAKKIAPRENATRAEIAKIIMTFNELYNIK